LLPALANKVTPDNVPIPKTLSNLFAINWLYRSVASCVLYYVPNAVFPDRETLIPSVITGETEVVEGVFSGRGSMNESSGNAEKG
jgi:hypothetical protein